MRQVSEVGVEGHDDYDTLRLLKIRNPHAGNEWTGPFSDADEDSWNAHPEALEACGHEVRDSSLRDSSPTSNPNRIPITSAQIALSSHEMCLQHVHSICLCASCHCATSHLITSVAERRWHPTDTDR